MIYANSSFFYINELINYTLSKNKFIDIKYAECNIQYFETKIIFDYSIYIANNFNLPSDSLRLAMNMPSQQISQILLIPSHQTIDINHALIDKNKTKIFKSKVIVDISDDNYFSNLSQQKNIPIKLNFSLDSDSLTNNQINVDHKNFANFISEMNELSLNMEFTHVNFINIKDAKEINHFSNIKINTDFLQTINNNSLTIDFPNFSSTIGIPIKKLLWIKIANNKRVELHNFNVVINYSDKNGSKEISANLMKNIIFYNEIFIDSNYELIYDQKKKEYFFQLGDGGIKFLFETKVNMKIYFSLIIDNKENKYFLENDFIWNTLLFNKINVENFTQELTNFKTIYEQK